MAYSDQILEATPERVTKFLTGLGAVATIRTLLSGAGMTDDDIVEGRSLLLQCLASPVPVAADSDTGSAKAQREATAELDERSVRRPRSRARQRRRARRTPTSGAPG